ncbi:hypothetical protein GCM10009099_15030 [Caenispirillum bisanense]
MEGAEQRHLVGGKGLAGGIARQRRQACGHRFVGGVPVAGQKVTMATQAWEPLSQINRSEHTLNSPSDTSPDVSIATVIMPSVIRPR